MKNILLVLAFVLASIFNASSEIEKTINSLSDSSIVVEWVEEAKGIEEIGAKLDLLKKSVEVSFEMNYYRGRFLAYLETAHTFHTLNSFSDALSYYMLAMEVADEMNNNSMRSICLNNIGGVYYNHENYDEAYTYYSEALMIREAIGDDRGIAGSLNNVAEIYRFQGKNALALNFYVRAEEINKRIKNMRSLAINQNNICLVHLNMDNSNLAAEYIQKSIGVSEELENAKLIAMSYHTKALLLIKKRKFKEAVDYLLKAIDSEGRDAISITAKDTYGSLAEAYQRMGNSKESLKYFKLFSSVKDSIFNKAKHKQLLLLEATYLESERNSELDLLRHNDQLNKLKIEKQSSERIYFIGGAILLVILIIVMYSRYKSKRQNNQLLRTNLAEKEVLLKEIHHRVKNNFQLISSLLNLQSKSFTDDKAQEAIEEGRSRINSMALVHEKLYETHALSGVPMQDYLKDLVQSISEAFKSEDEIVDIVIHAGDVTFDVDTAIPVGLIINELVTNSYKYAYKDKKKSRLEVRLVTKEHDFFELIVRDNGSGLPRAVNLKKLKSLGLELVQLLVEQLSGELKYDGERGATFTMQLRRHPRHKADLSKKFG